ncbi:helix-turn-helix domain-containing protein [Prosthecobacter sp.]|jgi:hypothetical protein|uniref:helix-turn-helix domain-containing protein n=1 Tax=Prosthecobacter sp. TaxID=1965333 RepID=UPI0037CA422D
MSEPSNARRFFDEVFNQPGESFQFLEKLALPASKTEETEWMDFKGAKQLTGCLNSKTPEVVKSEAESKIREIWSEYIGAFANSGGGVLIWGIDAPNKNAVGTSLVADVHHFSELLINHTKSVVDPPVQGVEVRGITRDQSPEGFVVCLVPQSKFAPHRSLFAKREYYLRCQDGNHSCPVAVLRRLFYPQAFSYLVPLVRLHLSLGDDHHYHLQGTVDIVNKGQASASEVFVEFKGGQQLSLNTDDWDKEPRNRKAYQSHKSIHPGQSLRLAHNLFCRLQRPDQMNATHSEKFEIRIYARNSTPIHRTFQISWADRSVDSEIQTEGEDAS